MDSSKPSVLDDLIRPGEGPSLEELPVLTRWQHQGVLRAIDCQWIEQLVLHTGEKDKSVLIAGALCSAMLGAGHICVDLTMLWEQALEGVSKTELHSQLKEAGVQSVEAWKERLCSSTLVSQHAEQAAPMVLFASRLYLYRYYHYEQQVLAYLERQGQASAYAVDANLLNHLFASSSSSPQTVDWQKVAVANAASLPFSIICGGPGTGKTTTVTKLLALLVAQSQAKGKSLRIELAAPTGKAAARLTESISKAKSSLPLSDEIKQAIPEQARTLHRLLGSEFGRSRFKHNRENPLHLDVLLVDEVSMVDLPMMAKLLDALPPSARLILLGDKDQLASVEAGSILGDLTQGGEQAYYSPDWAQHLSKITGEPVSQYANPQAPAISRSLTLLRTSYRFDENSGIGHLARAMNRGDYGACIQYLKQGWADLDWHQTESTRSAGNIAQLAKGYDAYWEGVKNRESIDVLYPLFSSYQVLTAVRQGEFGVEPVNAQLEQYFYRRGRIKDPHIWYPGKAIMMTRNDAALGLFNGDIGLCLPDDTQRLRVWFMQANGQFIGLLPSRLNDYETVFAMTVHKSQGSEFDTVALLLPVTPSPVVTRELIYTGITRARKHFSLWGDAQLLHSAAKTRIQRSSGLPAILWP